MFDFMMFILSKPKAIVIWVTAFVFLTAIVFFVLLLVNWALT